MSVVKHILVAACCAAPLAALLVRPAAPVTAPPDTPRAMSRPARADLAEAVLAMVLENAREHGLPANQPITLCQACLAAHIDLPETVLRQRCTRACGLDE